MTRTTTTLTAAAVRRPLAAAAVLVAFAFAVVLERAHTFAEPLENDVAGYAVIGHEMLGGRPLYADLWERKPPLLYATFAAAERVAGYGHGEVLLVNVVAALATLAGVFAAGRAGGAFAGLYAAGLWVLLGGDPGLQANQPNAEALVDACLTAAFALLLWRPRTAGAGFGFAVGVGLLFAAATLYKQHVVVTCGLLAVGHVLVPRPGTTAARRAGAAAVMGGVVAVAWGGLFAYFAAVGRVGPMVDVLFHQNRVYAGGLGRNLLAGVSPAGLFRPFMAWAVVPLALVAALVAAWVAGVARRGRWRRADGPRWGLWAAWSVGTLPAVALPGHLFPHYYQYWVPVACVAGGWAAAGLVDRSAGVPVGLGYGLAAVAAVVLAARELPDYQLTPDQWSDLKYPGGNYAEQERLGRSIGQLLRPGERFWVAGDDVTLYLAAAASPPSGLLYVDPLIDGDETAAYNRRLAADLARTRPDLVVLSPLVERFPPDAPTFELLRRDYAMWPTPLGWPHYKMMVRRGSGLQRRVWPDLPPLGG